MTRMAVACLRCGERLDGFTGVGTDGRMPTTGAVSMCMYCGDLALFVVDAYGVTLRPLSDAERAELLEDETIVALLAARQFAIDEGPPR